MSPREGRQLAAVMFADMVGFTALMGDNERVAMSKRAKYRSVLEAKHETFGGTIVQYYGDGALSIFPNSFDAVRCAVEVQKALRQPPGVAARIGLHVGDVIVERTGLIGDAVNIASRIESFGVSGGVLVSDAVHDHVRNHPSLSFVDLGEFALEDVERPFGIFAVSSEGLDVPTAESLAGKGRRLGPRSGLRTNLPTQLTSFVGRTVELASVEELICGQRLVTLIGPGGSGKTRLGVEIAQRVATEFPDGVWLVELARTGDPDAVPHVIADTLGVQISAGADAVETLCAAMKTQSALIVLDNFEHVIEAAPLVPDLLEAAPELSVLVTSRERLRVSGEHLFRVPALEPTDGTALFIQRAQAASPGFAPTDGTIDDIEAICERLDGLPLAIELAAARTDVLPPVTMRERLGSTLAVLKGGERDHPRRQQTLRDTIQWSYDLLQPQQQRLFVSLAVFVGGRSLEAVEAVCGPDVTLDVVDGLQSLTDKSLLFRRLGPDGGARFFFLETIHEYARDALADTLDSGALQRRHCEYFVALAERVAPPLLYQGGQDHLWTILTADADNLYAALNWAFAGGDPLGGCRLLGSLHFYWLNEPRREFAAWEGEAVKHADALEPLARARLYLALGRRGGGHQHIERAREYFSQALECAELAGDARVIAGATINLAATYAGDRDLYDYAMGLARKALREAKATDSPRLVARALNAMGEVARSHGDDEIAARAYGDALHISRENRDTRLTNLVRLNLSSVAVHRGDLRAAEELAGQVLSAGWEVDDQTGIAWGLGACAAAAIAAGQVHRGAMLLGAAERAHAVIGIAIQPADQPEYDRARASLAQQLGQAEVAAFMAEGRAMARSEAVAYALGGDRAE